MIRVLNLRFLTVHVEKGSKIGILDTSVTESRWNVKQPIELGPCLLLRARQHGGVGVLGDLEPVLRPPQHHLQLLLAAADLHHEVVQGVGVLAQPG